MFTQMKPLCCHNDFAQNYTEEGAQYDPTLSFPPFDFFCFALMGINQSHHFSGVSLRMADILALQCPGEILANLVGNWDSHPELRLDVQSPFSP